MQDNARQDVCQQTTVSDYGSDGEEYDELFIDFMSREKLRNSNTRTIGYDVPQQDQEMDVSMG